ncbi:MAG: PAS domain-containing protein, partial [Bacteroidota bacterium]
MHKTGFSNSGVWAFNLHLQEVWLSAALQQLFETSGKQPVESFIAIAHPDDRPALRKLLTELANGKPVQTVFRALTKTGISRHILLSGEPVPATGDQPLIAAGLASDLQSQLSHTTQKEAKKEPEFQTLHNATIETLIINHQTVEVFWSDNLFSLLGFSQQDFTPTPEHLFALLHPQDVELLREEQDTPREIRLKTRSDGFKWFLVISKKIMEVESLVSRMIYEFTDIDYLKRAEYELNKQNHDLSGIMQSSSTFMVLIDEKLDVIFYNDKANQAFLPIRKKVPLRQWSKYFINTNDAFLARRLHIAFHKNLIHDKYLESEISMPDNTQKTIAWYLSLVNYQGKKAILCTGVDVSVN